jgi:hypothetical protein
MGRPSKAAKNTIKPSRGSAAMMMYLKVNIV